MEIYSIMECSWMWFWGNQPGQIRKIVEQQWRVRTNYVTSTRYLFTEYRLRPLFANILFLRPNALVYLWTDYNTTYIHIVGNGIRLAVETEQIPLEWALTKSRSVRSENNYYFGAIASNIADKSYISGFYGTIKSVILVCVLSRSDDIVKNNTWQVPRSLVSARSNVLNPVSIT